MDGSKRGTRVLSRLALVTALVAALVLGQGVVPAAGLWESFLGPTLVSRGYQGAEATSDSGEPDISADGRYIAYSSWADNLISQGTGMELRAIYRFDRLTNTTVRVSEPPDGPMAADRGARMPKISDDGRYVLFFTGLALVPEDTNDGQDFYLKDMDTGEVRWIDYFGDGSAIGREVWDVDMAGDGSFFVFQSDDYDLLGTGKTTVRRNVWGYDLESDEATIVSTPPDPLAVADKGSRDPAITDDGRYVVFFTGSAWDAADTNDTGSNDGQDFYVRDMETGDMRWIDFHGDGSELGTNDIDYVDFAGDGSRFVFGSGDAIMTGATDRRDIYAYDLVSDEAVLVSGPKVEDRGSRDPSISDDGRWVAFLTGQSFVPDDLNSDWDENAGQDIYLKDMDTDEFYRVPIRGAQDAGSEVGGIRLSGDGEHLVFDSRFAYSVQDLNDDDDVYYYPLAGKHLAEGAERIDGDSRYATALEVSKKAFPNGATTVVIATGENWPDALGGSALAGAVEGPILLTPSGDLPDSVIAEIERLGAGNAYLLGGYAAISPAVETELNGVLPGFVWRLGGADRYSTSASIAKRVIALLAGAYDGRVSITTGQDFPDAVGAAPLGAGFGWPVVLVPPTATTVSLPMQVDGAAILGGEKAVGGALETFLVGKFGDAAVDRLGGDDRYETSAMVAQYGVDNGLVWDGVGIATGTNFPDSLAGGVALGLYRSPLLLTPGTALHPAAAAKLTANKADISTVVFLGGEKAVSAAVVTQVKNILEM